nr:uncharacterized mitochondrial protein AtMg00810-like [Tanacetum cinerariifolium]
PSEGELDLLFEAMYDDYFGGQPSATASTVPPGQEPQVHRTSTASTIIADTAPIPKNSSSHATNIPITSQDVNELNSNAMVDGNTFVNPFATSSSNAAETSSSQNVDPSNMHTSRLDLTYPPSTITTQQPSEGFIDADHPSHVYKLKKALYGLKQAPRAWYDELSKFLLQNHFFKGTIDPTLFIRHFQDDILVDSGFELTGFSDADYAGCKDTFKSTSGGAQFLGEKLVSWSSKKQDCTALSTAEAEYVSLSACCAQVLWMRTQLTDYSFHFNKILVYCDSKLAIAIS